MSLMRVKFVSRKLSRVRWKPQSSSEFITGSWDDEVNQICVWQCPNNSSMEDSIIDGLDPVIVAETSFPGSVTDLKVTSNDLIFATSTLGSLVIYEHTENKLVHHHTWDNIHYFSNKEAPATAVAIKGNDVASVGEDGRICIFNFTKLQKDRQIESSDLCALTAVNYLRHKEVVVGNVLGYLRSWDLRSSSEKPSHTSMLSGDQVGVMCMNSHATQPHILATGHEDGTLCIWDLRQDQRPATLLTGHSAAITDILFHPINPDYLYTCSVDGSVFQWDASKLKISGGDGNVVSGNPWLNCDASKHRIDITSLFPNNKMSVNTLDINKSTLLWGTDNEALYILPDLIV